jgi:hypothetical protein
MSDIQWKELSETISGMTQDERERLRGLLNGRTFAETNGDPLLGLMADEAPLLDQVVGEAMASRENDPFRSAK